MSAAASPTPTSVRAIAAAGGETLAIVLAVAIQLAALHDANATLFSHETLHFRNGPTLWTFAAIGLASLVALVLLAFVRRGRGPQLVPRVAAAVGATLLVAKWILTSPFDLAWLFIITPVALVGARFRVRSSLLTATALVWLVPLALPVLVGGARLLRQKDMESFSIADAVVAVLALLLAVLVLLLARLLTRENAVREGSPSEAGQDLAQQRPSNDADGEQPTRGGEESFDHAAGR